MTSPELVPPQATSLLTDPVAVERARLFVALRHALPIDAPWRGEALDVIYTVWQETAIAAEYARLGVPEAGRPTYTRALAQAGDVYAQLRECATRAALDSLTEDGVITDG